MSGQLEPHSSSPQPKRFRYQQAETVGHLYLATKLADVYFTSATPRHERIPAHKTILAANSDEFERMFYGESKHTGDITITDASEAVFKAFLQFFYLSEVQLTVENIAGVFGLGQKYNVRKCVDACTQILNNDLTDENVCVILAHAIRCAQNDVIKVCEWRIILNTASVFKSAGFLECSQESLGHILKMNLLTCSEVDVFEACMAWVAAKSQLSILTKSVVKKYLDDLYHEIRFASMTMPQFCKLSAKYNQVLSKDFEAITRIIVEPESQSSKFNRFPRQAEWNANDAVKCDRALGNGQTSMMFECKSETIFSTNRLMLLGQFTCDKIGCRGNLLPNLSVDVEITESSVYLDVNATSVLKMKAQLQSTETNVLLPQPVLIKPGFFYKICIQPFPNDHWFDSKELKREVLLDSDIKITFHRCRFTAKDKKVIGLISVLFFNRI